MIRNSSPSDVAFYSGLNETKTMKNYSPCRMIFSNDDGKEIGCLDFSGGKITFEGNAEKSARIFFDWAIRLFEEEIEKRVCSEMQRKPTKYALECKKLQERKQG